MPGALAKTKTPTRSISRHKLHHQFAQSRSRSVTNPMQQFSSHGAVARFCATALIGWQALPLVWTRFLRLANSSPKTARSPARRSRDGRATSGKKSGEISRVMSAQLPGNGRAVANAMPPNVRQDDSQDNLPCARLGRAMSAPETGETTRNITAQQPRRSSPATNATSRKQLVGISRRQLSTMTSKNYEHHHTTINARS